MFRRTVTVFATLRMSAAISRARSHHDWDHFRRYRQSLDVGWRLNIGH